MPRSEFHVAPPQPGQRYVDRHGCQWTVQATRSLDASDFPYAVADVEYRAANGIPATFKTSTRELARLASSGELKRLS